MWLTFDWDDVSLDTPIVKGAIKELVFLFGEGNVWYRISSSGTGLHLVVANLKWDNEIMQSVLNNQAGPAKDIVLLNAGAAIYCANLVDDLMSGVKKADEVISSGKAREKLMELISLTNELTVNK